MSDIMKVTSPIPGYENSPKTNPISPDDKLIQNIVDPTKVVRPDQGAGTTETKDQGFSFNYESNFETFLHFIKDANGLSENLANLLFAKLGVMVQSGVGENFAAEISKFLNLMKMDEGQLTEFIKDQSTVAVRFKGAFFDALHQILEATPSMELKTNILEFLKKYNDMTGGKHILQNIAQNIKNIADSIPNSFRLPLLSLLDKLKVNAENGDTAANTVLLKDKIIPFLSDYVKQTYDMGKARSLITLLTLNIARYENGSKDGLIQAFTQLLGYQMAKDKLEGIDPEMLDRILVQTEFKQAAEKSVVINQLIDIIKKGMAGDGGHESKAVFENIVNALLVNESVYMPLLHLIIPAEIFGQLMFSEMWIDPDFVPPGSENTDEKRRIKLFIKFDIKDLGYFEMILSYQNDMVDLQLYYPKTLAVPEKEIRTSVANIMERNGLTFKTFLLEKCNRPKSISEIFPKIYERKNSVNVRI